jgi:hypothetical protein
MTVLSPAPGGAFSSCSAGPGPTFRPAAPADRVQRHPYLEPALTPTAPGTPAAGSP